MPEVHKPTNGTNNFFRSKLSRAGKTFQRESDDISSSLCKSLGAGWIFLKGLVKIIFAIGQNHCQRNDSKIAATKNNLKLEVRSANTNDERS